VVKKEDYDKAVTDFVKYLSEELGEYIKAIYVAGSYARGDFVPGKSDIDIYVVLNKRDQNIENKIIEIAKGIEEKYLKEVKYYHWTPFSAAITDMEEIKSGKSWLGVGWEYYIFIREGKLLYGEDIRDTIPKPSNEAIITLAKDFIENGIPTRGQSINQCFSLIFRSAAIFLSLKGKYVASKREVVEEFEKEYGSHDIVKMLKKAYDLWTIWSKRDLNDEEYAKLALLAVRISEELKELLKSFA